MVGLEDKKTKTKEVKGLEEDEVEKGSKML